MYRLLTIGASGLLGSKITVKASEKYETFGTYHKNSIKFDGCTLIQVDIKDSEETINLIERIKPDCVVHTAALTMVDYCEQYQDDAWAVNVCGTEAVANGCEKIGAKLIYISTDYVFDGKRGYYTEDDIPNPVTYYSLTKLEGERIVQKKCTDYAIVRVCVLYGWQPAGARLNFVTWVLEKLKKCEYVRLFIDAYATPTFADNAADAILKIIENNKHGIYHVAGCECINRYEFGKKIASVFGLDKNLLKPVKMADIKLAAKRPKNSCLVIEKLIRELNIQMLGIEEGLKIMHAQREGVCE